MITIKSLPILNNIVHSSKKISGEKASVLHIPVSLQLCNGFNRWLKKIFECWTPIIYKLFNEIC